MKTRRGQFVLGGFAAFVVLLIVAVVGVATGWIGSRPLAAPARAATQPPTPAGTTTPAAPSATSPAPASGPSSAMATGQPATSIPKTNDSIAFAKAVATMAFSYDTRTESRDAWQTALMGWLGPDGHYDTLAEAQGDVARVVPQASVWAQMRDLRQRASFTVTAAYVPQQAVAAEDQYGSQWPPGTSVVTVRGNQHLTWNGGSESAARIMTLFVLCQPSHAYCMIDRITPQVLP